MTIVSLKNFFSIIKPRYFFFYLYSWSISYDFIYFKKLTDIFKIKKKTTETQQTICYIA